MKLKVFYKYLILFSFCGVACTIQFDIQSKNDGYQKANKMGFSEFQSAAVSVFPETAADSINIMEINGTQLNGLIPDSGKAWVLFWTYWCGACSDEIPNSIKISREKGISLYIVTTNYQINKYMNTLRAANFRGTAFIVSNKEYGDVESKKQLNFIKDITKKTDSLSVFPLSLFFRNKQFIYEKKGIASLETIEKIFEK